MSAGEALRFCRNRGMLNKEYKSWMMAQTKDIIGHADQYAKDNCGDGILPLPTWRTRKEAVAHERQQRKQMSSGLIGVWSCLEAGSSYRARYCAATGYPQLQNYQTRATICIFTLMTPSLAS